MHKTLLAALIGTSVFAVLPALAQVDLGAAGRAGAGVAAGASGGMTAAPGRPDTLAGQTLQRADRHARHATEQTHHALNRHSQVDVDTAARGSAGMDAGDQRADASAGIQAGARVDAGSSADRARGTAQGIGDQVSDSTHMAIDGTRRRAGAVGDAARRTATGTSVGAEAKVRARTDAHGH